NRNGYDLIVEAAKKCEPLAANLDDMTPPQLQEWVAKNQAVLATVRRGLALPCRFPLNQIGSQEYSAAIGRARNLALLLVAEGRGFEQAGQPAQAARSYLEAIRLGFAITQGGTMFHHSEGLRHALIGGRALDALRPKLGAADCRQAALEIARDIRGIPSPADAIERDRREFFKGHAVLHAVLRVRRWFPNSSERLTENTFLGKRAGQLDKLRQLVRDLDQRAKDLEEGRKQ
ncbi:MAG TPA: hypothetical protein VHH73_17415, partial [Verrucomicrobiae bacterium]|nr:hypothetical protein [Verrucomicrobiae bacterium]